MSPPRCPPSWHHLLPWEGTGETAGRGTSLLCTTPGTRTSPRLGNPSSMPALSGDSPGTGSGSTASSSPSRSQENRSVLPLHSPAGVHGVRAGAGKGLMAIWPFATPCRQPRGCSRAVGGQPHGCCCSSHSSAPDNCN